MHRTKNLLHLAAVAGAVGIIIAAAVAGPSYAAKGGRPHATVPSSISLDQPDAWLGESVTFTSDPQGLKGSEWPMIGVTCSQSGAVVYGALDTPDATFVLGGNSSVWRTNGGAADCTATLYAYGWTGGAQTIRTLASTSFAATGS